MPQQWLEFDRYVSEISLMKKNLQGVKYCPVLPEEQKQPHFTRTLNSPELSEAQILRNSLEKARWKTLISVTSCLDQCTYNECSTTLLKLDALPTAPRSVTKIKETG